MELQLVPLLSRSLAALAVFVLYNFAAIYPMSRAVMFDPGSWRKAMRVSFELGFLSTVYAGLVYLIFDFAGIQFQLSTSSLESVAAIAGYILVVELFRIWYVRREYDSTWLYGFIVAETVPMVILLIYFLVSNVLALPM